MNNSQAKKIRKLYNRDFKAKYKDVYIHLLSIKPRYIPKRLWVYWLNK